MEDAFKRAGITGKKIKRGEIYLFSDKWIVLPKTRIPSQPPRIEHPERLVLILQSDSDNDDVSYPIILIAPLSHRTDLKDDKDYELHKGDGGIWMDSLVQLGLIQPVLKIELIGNPIGELDTVTMNEINAIIAANLGLIERPNP